MSLIEFLIFHILPSRTCKKSTESWKERGEDQKAIGSHNSNNWFISLVKVCVHICIGEGNGNPLQYSCLENPMDGGAW